VCTRLSRDALGIPPPDSISAMWLIVEPCGILCVILIYAILIFSDSVMCFGMMFPWDTLASKMFVAFYQILLFLVTWSHLTCMLSDPGVVSRDDQEMQAIDVEGQKKCKKCDAPKPFRAHHCSICKRCIMKMDHHCPWVNTCVAEYNQKHFLLFLIYVFLLCAVTLAVLLSKMLSCHNDSHAAVYSIDIADFEEGSRYKTVANPSSADATLHSGTGANISEVAFLPLRKGRQRIRMYCGLTQGYMLGGMGLFFVALLFGLFTIAMFGDQISSLMQNQTNIEQLQQTPAKPRSLKSALQDVCGGSYTWRWLFPFPIKKSMKGVTY